MWMAASARLSAGSRNRTRPEASRGSSRKASIAIVGHEPNLGELAARLLGAKGAIEFKKGAVCRIDFEVFPPFSARLIVHFPNGGRLWILNAASPVALRLATVSCVGAASTSW